MTFIPDNSLIDDESSLKSSITEDIYHFKIHEGLGYSLSLATTQAIGSDFVSALFTTPFDINDKIKMHTLFTFNAAKGATFELYENVIVTPKLPVLATAILVGSQYMIKTKGTTDFTLIGSRSNAVGTVFTATALGIGTGTVVGEVIKTRMRNRASFGPHLSQVILCANMFKKIMNAHAADILEHPVPDIINFPILTPDAIDLPTLITLISALQAAYIAHHADALLLLPINHVGQFLGTLATLSSAIPPTTLAGARNILQEMQKKYNIHDNSTLSHGLLNAGIHNFGLVLGDSLLTNSDGVAILATTLTALNAGKRLTIILPGTTDFTLLGAPDNNIGTIFIYNGVLPLGTGTVSQHFFGHVSASTLAPLFPAISTLFSGGELIEQESTSKTISGGSDSLEFILKENTTYGVRVFDPALNGSTLGFKMNWFEVPII